MVLFLNSLGCAQQLKGVVLDVNKEPVFGATLTLDSKHYSVADERGNFSFKINKGTHTLKIEALGFVSIETIIRTTQNNLVFVLKKQTNELEEIVIKAETKGEKIKKTGYAVNTIDVKKIKNLSYNTNEVLKFIPGVNIRQTGGLGSDFNFSINGLSGKQIRFFINDIPVENLGSSFSFNNFPLNLVDNIEVYKGVSPIKLGADALGGSVNILTSSTKKNILDVSYSTGSFNTHIISLLGQYHHKNGFIFKASGFYNYSDNDYKIDNIIVRDELGNDLGKKRDNVKRFHDAYKSQMMSLQGGVENKSYADLLLLGITASANKNELQHSLDPQVPFGEVLSKNQVFLGSIVYKKDSLFVDNLKLKIYASVGKNIEQRIDTASRVYNWLGKYKERFDKTLGEFESQKTLFKFDDKASLINITMGYKINKSNSIDVNFSKNYVKRQGTDKAKQVAVSFENPHDVNKNIMGISYNFDLFRKKITSSVFTKNFNYSSETTIVDPFKSLEDPTRSRIENNTYNKQGYGIVSSYNINNNLRVKASFENTYRTPDGYEVFGDGFTLRSNPELEPEESNNVNLGLFVKREIKKAHLSLDINTFYRKAKNFIVIKSQGIFSQYFNTESVVSSGIESEIKVSYNKLSFKINGTCQNIIDQNAGVNNGVDFLKNQRIANIPYLFGNLGVNYSFNHVFTQKDKLLLYWDASYVNEYPLTSFVEGSASERNYIETQVAQNFNVSYSLNRRYNMSLQVKNILDNQLYDNFEIQQPGRSFYLKIRYNLIKNN